MFETSLSKMKEWEQVVTDIDQRELVVLRDVTRLPVERGDFISPNMVVIISMSGQVSLLYDMQTFVFNPWNVAVVCPNHMVAPIDVSSDYNAILMVISPALYEEMRRRTLSHDYIKFHSNPQFSLTVEQAQSLIKIVDVIEMISRADVVKMQHRHELLTYMFDVFFETMSMYLAKDDASSISLNKNEILFSSFCELLAKNYREHKTMTWYAEQLHLTPKYFSSQIMRIIGKSASDWIQEWLLIRAKQLLDTRWDMNIQEISQSLGFEEQASFTRFFRRGAGMSPRQWRERDTAARAARG